ncbi:aldose 1-epimerase family protein [Paeniglutamicibacter cryotolerans]|uniref:Aldose 1-epimerase n=1 Tax=Paeniglutamicibacter cryotolerans TaxID=670079 RepID=A0A839QJ97_9MICC|nr:aldose 1-epimerase family protein [Paeniglutamicibacter cryotolerans]MBB2995920.1 aldose 1-epimerase [Paeniglutamicibacter cryotolerans]
MEAQLRGSGHATGSQFRISSGGAEAVITELAAALRIYRRHGIDLAQPFGVESAPPGASGILLAPWPNRVADGRWMLDGAVQQLDITERARGHASHGLLRNTGYACVAQESDFVTLRAEIFPQHGYPLRLTHEATYRLDADGHLEVRQSLHNRGPRRAPVALGAHPYLCLGDLPSGELVLRLAAETWLEADDRLIPIRARPVAGDTDFRAGSRVGDHRIDRTYTGLSAVENGRFEHALEARDGRSVVLWADAAFPYVHVFITEVMPGREVSITVEPMTAPANALNSGEGLIWLEPGARLSGNWGIRSCL